MTKVDFQNDVIETSKQIPVLVDFWAEWCGPCRTLGPILDDLASESEGAWRLVKVNTDLQPQWAEAYRVSGIPAVKLFVDGEVIAEFGGAAPKSAVAQWLQQNLPNSLLHRVEEARQLRLAGRREEAIEVLSALLKEDPDSEDARLEWAYTQVLANPAAAWQQVASITSRSAQFERAQQVQCLFQLNQEQDRDDLDDDCRQALEWLFSGQIEAAIERMIDLLARDKHYGEDLVRKGCIALFDVLGSHHDLVKRWRKRFEMTLF